MTLAEEIQQKLAVNPGLTDRELTDLLRGKDAPQQAVNQACRALESRGLIARRPRPDGRIGNYLHNPTGVSQPVQTSDPEPHPLSEDALKQVLKAWLESAGWQVQVAWAKTPGADIVADRAGERWVIEVKGQGSREAMRVNYFLAILGETLQRMNDANATYSIALPDLPQYRGLWRRLPDLAKNRTGISILFVSEDGTVTVLGNDHPSATHSSTLPEGDVAHAPNDVESAQPGDRLLIRVTSEDDAWPPYNRKRLRRAVLVLAAMLPWTFAWLVVLVPLSIVVPFITIPLMLLVMGVPGAWAFVALLEELMRRSHLRSLAARVDPATEP